MYISQNIVFSLLAEINKLKDQNTCHISQLEHNLFYSALTNVSDIQIMLRL